jgi:hypothetical protein
MADAKISDLSAGTALAGTEVAPFVQSGSTVKITGNQVKTLVLTTPLAVVGSAAGGAELRLPEDTDNGSSYVALKAPDSLAGTYTLTFPADDGASGEVLSTDGSGVLSWAASGGASAPLTLASGTITDNSTALTVTQTWNDAADTFTAVLVNVTETASAAGSKILDLQEAGTSVLSVARNTTGGFDTSEWRLVFGSAASIGWAPDYGLTFRNAANSALVGLRASGLELTGGVSFGAEITATGLHISEKSWRGAFEVVGIASDCGISWSSTTTATATKDAGLIRVGAGVIGVRGASTSAGGALNFIEQTAPAAPAATQVVVYAEDNGSGKTRLMARFETGAAQQIAIEP